MVSSLIISFLAKVFLAGIAFLCVRVSLHFLDKTMDFSFKRWVNKLEETKPEALSLYYGLRLVAIAILFGFILS